MDGNNRWSKKKSLSKLNAYKKGAENLIKLSHYLFNNTEAKYISAFALSKNNLERPTSVLNIIKKVLKNSLKQINDNKLNFDIHFLGKFDFLDKETQNFITKFNQSDNFYKKLFIYINYGGREDLENAANNLKKKKSNLKSNLITSHLPDPDILIRTGGFRRISNFLLYEIAFTDFFFLDKLWPDLSNADLRKIIKNYSSIERKFGR